MQALVTIWIVAWGLLAVSVMAAVVLNALANGIECAGLLALGC